MEDGKSAITELTAESIKDRIYTIRGVQVMLDSDLAKLYGVETKYKQSGKKKSESFSRKFLFSINKRRI